MARKQTDEEFGRYWAAKHGKAPRIDNGHWCWWDRDRPREPFQLPLLVYHHLRLVYRNGTCGAWYPSEAVAYEELGRALREIIADVKRLELF